MITKQDIEKYFNAEKAESMVFFAIGLIAIGVAIYALVKLKTSFYNGLSIPCLLIGLLMLTVGTTIFLRSDKDRIKNVYALDMNPGALKEVEVPRMQKVMKSFVTYRYTEIVLLVIGLALFVYFRDNAVQTFYKGLGLGLVVMAVCALAADYFAEARGKIYLDLLNS